MEIACLLLTLVRPLKEFKLLIFLIISISRFINDSINIQERHNKKRKFASKHFNYRTSCLCREKKESERCNEMKLLLAGKRAKGKIAQR